jgi:hypothetical protein
MTNPIIRIHNTETGEIIDRPMNDQEYELFLESQKEPDLTEKEIELRTAKMIAESKLQALGLTAEDLKALGLGGN